MLVWVMKTNAFGLKTRLSEVAPSKPSRSQLLDARKLLLAESADPIIKRAISIALNDDHPGQMSAMKMCIDRLLPMGEFEARKDGTRSQVTITISGIGEAKIEPKDIVDAEEV